MRLKTLPEAQQTQTVDSCNLSYPFSIAVNFPPGAVRLALVANFATRWRHLHWAQSWPLGGAKLPRIVLLASLFSSELVSSSASSVSKKSLRKVTHRHPDPSIVLLKSDPRYTWAKSKMMTLLTCWQ